MKGRSKFILNIILIFISLLVLAFILAELAGLTGLPWWAQAAIVFLGTKTLSDLGSSLFRRERKYLYFEDYIREITMFMAVAVIAILGVTAVESYIGGVVWTPLLAAALVIVWR